MFTGLDWSPSVLVGTILLFPTPMAVAQDDPAGGSRPGGPEAAAAPAATENAAPTPTPDFCRCVGESDSAAVARIEKVLNSPLSSKGIDFSETPLEEVVHLLQEEYGFPIQIDEPALEAIGLDPSENVTANLHNISLRSALRLILKRLQLTYIIAVDVLLITSPEEAEARLSTCVYNVRDFLTDTSDRSMEELIDTIVSCVATETWAENGGGEAEIRALKPGLLVVSQTQAVHEEISGLLKAIHDMRGDHTIARDTKALAPQKNSGAGEVSVPPEHEPGFSP